MWPHRLVLFSSTDRNRSWQREEEEVKFKSMTWSKHSLTPGLYQCISDMHYCCNQTNPLKLICFNIFYQNLGCQSNLSNLSTSSYLGRRRLLQKPVQCNHRPAPVCWIVFCIFLYFYILYFVFCILYFVFENSLVFFHLISWKTFAIVLARGRMSAKVNCTGPHALKKLLEFVSWIFLCLFEINNVTHRFLCIAWFVWVQSDWIHFFWFWKQFMFCCKSEKWEESFV